MTNAFRVAVVDDEAPVRVALGRLLRLAQYDVDSFASGEEFLVALQVQSPDCVIMDVHMPGLSGLEVQSHMRAQRREVPVVFISASDGVDVGVAVIKAGGERLLRKPFSSSDLLEAVDSALHRKA